MSKANEYIASVAGSAHMSAVQIIEALEAENKRLAAECAALREIIQRAVPVVLVFVVEYKAGPTSQAGSVLQQMRAALSSPSPPVARYEAAMALATYAARTGLLPGEYGDAERLDTLLAAFRAALAAEDPARE